MPSDDHATVAQDGLVDTGGQYKRHKATHAAYWPPYSRKNPRAHNLCYLEKWKDGRYRLMWRGGGVSSPIDTYSDFKAECNKAGGGVDCYVGDVQHFANGFPWIMECAEDQNGVVYCNNRRTITGATIRMGNKWVSIGSLSSWHKDWHTYDDKVTILDQIVDFCEYVGVGVYTSPGTVGYEKLRQVWSDVGRNTSKKSITRPPDECRSAILEGIVGGRVETFILGKRVNRCYELDLRSAYPSCASLIPWGSAILVGGDQRVSPDRLSRDLATWYARCDVTVPEQLAVSPVPIRDSGTNRWSFPTGIAFYENVYLWKEEVHAALQAGCDVTIRQAYGWESFSKRLQPWVASMEGLRNGFESIGEPGKAKWIKSGAVSAIGRLGCGPIRYTVSSKYSPGSVPGTISGSGGPIATYYIREEYDRESPAPVHVFSYILARCRLKVYQRELDEIYDGNGILASNFDAIYLTKPSRLPVGKGIGDWKQCTLEEAMHPYPRSVVSASVVRLPGLTQRTSASFAVNTG